ncbi:effector-associated constant component EACC1 [Streptomyces sp. NPDC002144]
MSSAGAWDEGHDRARPVRELAVRVRIAADPGADPETVDRSARQLRAELAELGAARLEAAGPPPPGAKGDAVTVGAIVVALSASGGVLTALVDTLRDWLARRAAGDRVSVTIDGDTLELDRATAAERAAVVEAYVGRHSAPGGDREPS